MEEVKIFFPNSNYQSITLEKYTKLTESLTVKNSPVLFGCRTGICGTCLVVVKGDVPSPTSEEKEILEIYAPGNHQARLACQVELTSDIEIYKL